MLGSVQKKLILQALDADIQGRSLDVNIYLHVPGEGVLCDEVMEIRW